MTAPEPDGTDMSIEIANESGVAVAEGPIVEVARYALDRMGVSPLAELSTVTAMPGFPDRTGLVARYAERSGRDVGDIRWYEALASWKAAVFLEASYARHLAGTTDDPYFARLGEVVPALGRLALQAAEGTTA